MNGECDFEVQYLSNLSSEIDKKIEKKSELGAGVYYIVFENTDLGYIIPPMNFSIDQSTFPVKISKKELK